MISEETKLLLRSMFPEWERELYANRESDFPAFYYHKSARGITRRSKVQTLYDTTFTIYEPGHSDAGSI